MSLDRESASRAGQARSGQQPGTSHGEHQPSRPTPGVPSAAAQRRAAAPPWPACSWVTMWTSIVAASRAITVPADARRRARAPACRRLAPSTIWVALTPRAKSSSAAGTSSPTTWWKVPPRSSTRVRWAREVLRGRRRRARRCGRRGRRAARRLPSAGAIRAARRIRVSPSGPPVSATTIRSRASQCRSMSVLGRYCCELLVDPVGHPQQGQLAQRGEVAGPEVVATGRRRPCPAA